MVHQKKKLVQEVSGWLRIHDDGSVDRTWTGPPEVKFMAEPVPPHEEFKEGVAVLRSKSEMEQPESPFLTLDMVDSFLKLALPEGCTKDHPFTRPGGHAAPPLDGLNLPPFLLCVAESDLIRDTQMEYYEAMKEASKDLELLINPGVGHSFYLNKIAVDMDPHTAAQTTALMEGIIEFIKKH
ncbi:CELL DEATH ASSOCIATED PROTEIN [Salix koriyanagi]|uniref:CELL DEATH ASSOCIATED PROTEIN n=1 Tax=Salix koriyanagi TaxID=2511006 RepID=A0A9Q0PUU1_9ROSI|nr:CELL DEATH ASSOCIATED PROTEIN [Salix koriyanagi]